MKKLNLIAIFGVVLIFVMGLSAPVLASPDPLILVTPLELDFGEVDVGTTSSQEVLIKNINVYPLNVFSVGFASGSSQDFSVVTNPDVPCLLLSGADVIATVTFSPSSAGEHIARLVVASDDPESSLIEVLISGIKRGN